MMIAATRTPGEWRVDLNRDWDDTIPVMGGNQGDMVVACVWPIGGESEFASECQESLGNARLIAAAPDLLSSLTEMVTYLLAHAAFGFNDQDREMLIRAEATIAKARGGAS